MLFQVSSVFQHCPCCPTSAVTAAPLPSLHPTLLPSTVLRAPETASRSEPDTVTKYKTWGISMDSDKVNQLSQAVFQVVENTEFSLGFTWMSSGKWGIRTDCLDCCASRLLCFSLMLNCFAVLLKKANYFP